MLEMQVYVNDLVPICSFVCCMYGRCFKKAAGWKGEVTRLSLAIINVEMKLMSFDIGI